MKQARDDNELLATLRRYEGWVPHAYQDHLGFWTIGYGRLIDRRRGGGISREEGDYLLSNDVEQVERGLRSRLDCWDRLTITQRRALINMGFQLGVNGVMNFRRMVAALERSDWAEAEREALDSRWAQQTPGRATEVAADLRDGRQPT